MTDNSTNELHWTYWLIGAIALLWNGAGISFGAGEIVGIIMMPLAVAAFLLWYARHAGAKAWTR